MRPAPRGAYTEERTSKLVELTQQNDTDHHVLEDVHRTPSNRQIALNLVGVNDIHYPITVTDRDGHSQQTIGKMSLGVDLPKLEKGAHMSRFVEVISEGYGPLNLAKMPNLLKTVRERLGADNAHVEIKFPFFLERTAPVSGAKALMDYECTYSANVDGSGSTYKLGVRVPVASLCPCSKAISDYGAHNQRGYVDVQVSVLDLENQIWISDLVEIAENSASAPVYPILKRPDERFVTMQAYDNPVFVEDIVREVAFQLTRDERVMWFNVVTTNHESIHNHNVYGQVEWHRYRNGR